MNNQENAVMQIEEVVADSHVAGNVFLGRKLPINHPGTRRQSGATVEQFMFWAILAAGVILAAIYGYSRGSTGQTGADFVTEFNEIGSTASNVYSGQWALFTTANAEKSGLFHNYANVTDAGGGVVNIKGGGTLTVAPGTLQNANDSGQFTITGMAEEACKKVIVGAAGSAGTMTLNATAIKAFGGKLDPTASCNATNNTIVVVRS